MKFTQRLLSIIFFFLLFGALESKAQQTREMRPLADNDFECLKSLECAQNSPSLKEKGWRFIFDESVDGFTQEFRAIMKGENISFFALYDKQGYLVRSEYKRKDVALPTPLLTHLFQSNYKDLKLIGTELVMKDFDPATVKYKVVLENNAVTMVEKYDYEFINDLHLQYEGLTKY